MRSSKGLGEPGGVIAPGSFSVLLPRGVKRGHFQGYAGRAENCVVGIVEVVSVGSFLRVGVEACVADYEQHGLERTWTNRNCTDLQVQRLGYKPAMSDWFRIVLYFDAAERGMR